jgi:preprotein translocase subunit YajC
MTIICILSILAIYYFIIKRQRKEIDIPQTSSTDLVHKGSNSEITL